MAVCLSSRALATGRQLEDTPRQFARGAQFHLAVISMKLIRLCSTMRCRIYGTHAQGRSLALKSKVLLYAASPLFNTNVPYLDFGANNNLICLNEPKNMVWWERAAAVADSCIRWAEQNGCYLITDQGVDANYQYSWEVYDNPEIILAEKCSSGMGCWNRPWSGIIPSTIIAGSSGTTVRPPLLNFVRKYEDREGNKVEWNGGDDLQAKMANP